MPSLSESSGTPTPSPDEVPRDPFRDESLRGATPASVERQGATHRSTAYCSATDRNIPVLIRQAPRGARRARPSYRDAEQVLCLDYGVRCTGYLCPLFDVATLDEQALTEMPHPRPS